MSFICRFAWAQAVRETAVEMTARAECGRERTSDDGKIALVKLGGISLTRHTLRVRGKEVSLRRLQIKG